MLANDKTSAHEQQVDAAPTAYVGAPDNELFGLAGSPRNIRGRRAHETDDPDTHRSEDRANAQREDFRHFAYVCPPLRTPRA